MTGNQLFESICDRIVIDREPVQNMRDDLARAFRKLLSDGYNMDRLKRLLNCINVPTVSGKAGRGCTT